MTKFKIVTGCLFFLFTLPVFAQEEGIRFFKGKWKEVLAEAKQSGKLIFVDMYTNWCEPCKKIEEEVFPQKVVGDKYNEHFINYRVNAEKGEGWSIGDKYLVRAYPTYLYVNGDGALVYKVVVYSTDPKRLLIFADSALQRQEVRSTLTAYREVYESRKNDKAFLRQYANWLRSYNMSPDTISHVLDQYFSLLKPAELKDPAIVSFLLNTLTTVQSPVFDHVISQQSFYSTIFKQFSKTLGSVVLNSFLKAINAKNEPLFFETLVASKKLENPSLLYPYSVFLFTNQYYLKNNQVKRMIERSPVFLDRVCLMEKEEILRKDRQQFEDFMEPYLSGEADSTQVWDFNEAKEIWRTGYSQYAARALIITAENFLQHAGNKTDLRKACRWAEKAVELDQRNTKYRLVLSRLYAKAGIKREAG